MGEKAHSPFLFLNKGRPRGKEEQKNGSRQAFLMGIAAISGFVWEKKYREGFRRLLPSADRSRSDGSSCAGTLTDVPGKGRKEERISGGRPG